jgi:hypothetical protein
MLISLKSFGPAAERKSMDDFNSFLKREIAKLEAANAQSEARLVASMVALGYTESEARAWIACEDAEAA